MHLYTFEKICCPRCLSKHLYKYGHDLHHHQKYLCRSCNHQFTLEASSLSHEVKYFKCPICNHATFIWHRYDTYIHFKCSSKKCNHSFKISIPPPEVLLQPDHLEGVFSFSHFRTPPFIIFMALSLYFDGNMSTRAIQRFLFQSLNFSVSHVSIHYWTKAFSGWFKLISDAISPSLNLASDEWHADETFIKIKGVQHYLWILLDSETRFVISFVLSDKRDSSQAYLLFLKASCLTDAIPKTIITDHWDAYNQAIATVYPDAVHYCYKDFSDDRSNNLIEAFNHTFKAWYRTKKGFKSFSSSLSLITVFLFHYNFLHQHSSLSYSTPALVAGAVYSSFIRQRWLLF